MLNRLKRLYWKSAWGKNHLQRRFDARALNFYRQFINPGDVVIDVGANHGNRAKIFLILKAFAVLIEPQEKCIEHLKKKFAGRTNWVLIEAAVGRAEGEMQMLINTEDTLSSFSTEWVSKVQETGRFGHREWNQRQKARMTTLDIIIKEYGVPAFIKIDVEGFEKEVLSGLTIAPKALSIEFTPECIQTAFDCIDHLTSLGEFEFQVSLYESLTFELDNWLPAQELKDYLMRSEKIFGKNVVCFGDIYAKQK